MDAGLLGVNVGDSLYYSLIYSICFAVLYGTFLLATIIAILLLSSSREGDLRSRQRLLLILFTIILFIINTADFVDTFGPIFVGLREALMISLSGIITQQSEVADNALDIWGEITPWPTTVSMCISDTLVVWRAVAVWTGNEWVKWGLVTITLVDIGFNLAQGVLADLPFSLTIETKADTASIYISLVTNLVATALIGLKFWLYRNSLRDLLGEHRPTEVQKVLLLLVESGGIFLVVQIAMTVMTNILIKDGAVPLTIGYDIMYQIFEETCNLYPVAVIIMINCRNSLVNISIHYDETKTNAGRVSSSMVHTQ